MAKNTEKGKNVKSTLRELEYDKKTEKRGKFDTNTFGPGIWRENLKNVENEECTLQDLDYGEKTEHHGK